MTDDKKIELLAEAFDCDADELSADVLLEDLDNWGSMAKLSLIVLMDDEFDKVLTSDEIKGFVTVGDVMDYME